MSSYYVTGQLKLYERAAIELGINQKESFKKIAQRLGRHPTTISNEVIKNRTFVQGQYYANKDCKFARQCVVKRLCGCEKDACNLQCKYCKGIDCTKVCKRYVSMHCRKFDSIPYVCNACKDKKQCMKDRFFYNAVFAEANSKRRQSDSHRGFRITETQLRSLDELLTRLVRKGQPLAHIYAEHSEEIPIGLRSLYNYIDSGKLTIRNIDLRRKTGYKPRKKAAKDLSDYQLAYRKGKTYDDFLSFLKNNNPADIVELDTVKGRRERGKRLLTFIFRKNSVMLLFLMPDGKAESVKQVFDYLEMGLGTERFKRLFPVILTDNGSEFKRVDDLERNDSAELRTNVFYCDPMASWQKPHLEKNHEFIRYVLPKGKSFSPYWQDDITLLMNHINSTRRPNLGDKSPYELVDKSNPDFMALWELLKMDLIPPDEVHLKPDLFTFNF